MNNTTKISREEYLLRLSDDEPALRSCWNCNSAHNHLKKANYLIWCFECGKYCLVPKKVNQFEKTREEYK